MDFGMMMQMKNLWDRFTKQHPKLPDFLQAVRKKGLPEGTSVEIKFEYPDGSRIKGGVVIKAEDLALFAEAAQLAKNAK